MSDAVPLVRVDVLRDGAVVTLSVQSGTNLRRALLDAGISPYAALPRQINCNGRGLCATCGVRILSSDADLAPEQWHDALAARFGYPRLSCKITIRAPLTVQILTEKWIWGARERP